MTESTIDRSHGRWSGILMALGVSSKFLTRKHGPCPICAGTDRFRYDDRSGDGDYFCSQCGAGKGLGLLMKLHGWDFKTAASRVDEIVGTVPAKMARKAPRLPDNRALRQLWSDSTPITQNSPAWLYLASRGIERIPPVLRYVAKMRYQDDVASYHPGMVAMVHGPDGKPWTIHRTYLTEDGRKADLDPPRKLMSGAVKDGMAIRLSDYTDVLGIAEGIETALSAELIHGIPCWSAINEGLMRKWNPPAGVKKVVIFGDNDPSFTGQAAAYDLAKRLATTMDGLEVNVMIPKWCGMDWSDVWRQAIL